MMKRLFDLLQSVLWNKDFVEPLETKVAEELLREAQQHAIAGLVIEALTRSDQKIDKKVLFEMVALRMQIEQQNRKVNRELKAFVKGCEEHKVDYIIVKGQTIGSLYDKPELRQPGDIDVLTRESFRKIRVYLSKFLNTTLPEELTEKAYSVTVNGVLFELHGKLFEIGNKKIRTYWNSLIEEAWQEPYYCTVDGEKVRTLPPTLNAVYIFLHMFHHFLKMGVGLRQVCDWAVFLHKNASEIDTQKLQEILQALDIEKAFKAFGWVLVNRLGLPEEEFPVAITEEDKKWKKAIVHDIMEAGNFGRSRGVKASPWTAKLHTMWWTVKNAVRYYSLAPSEIRYQLPKLVAINFKIIKAKMKR